MQSSFKSYKKDVKVNPLTVARSGFLEPKGSFTLFLKELLHLVPYSSYFMSCPKTQLVSIAIFEKFDNADFGTQSIDFLVPNDSLQFKAARLRVRTSLFGPRYYMQ